MRLSCSGVKARGNAMPSPRCSNFSARRLLLKEPLLLPSSSPFGLCGYSAICKRTWCYISLYLIVWILKLLPHGVSPPTADKTVSAASAAQRHGAGVDAWKGAFVVYYIIIFFQALDCVETGNTFGLKSRMLCLCWHWLWDPSVVADFRYFQ